MSKYYFDTGNLLRNSDSTRNSKRSRTPQPQLPPSEEYYYFTEDDPSNADEIVLRDRAHSFGSSFHRSSSKKSKSKSKNHRGAAPRHEIVVIETDDPSGDFAQIVDDLEDQRGGNHGRLKTLDDFEHRRKYVSSVLDRYYSHPSNRYHSMPSTIRKQFVDSLAVPSSTTTDRQQIEPQKSTTTRRPSNSLYLPDDSTSELSIVVPSYGVTRSARATPDPSMYDEEFTTFDATRDYQRHQRQSRKSENRFFRSSSIRSLKKLMNKLRGSSNNINGGGSGRSKSSESMGGGWPTRSTTDPQLYQYNSVDYSSDQPSVDSGGNYNNNNQNPSSYPLRTSYSENSQIVKPAGNLNFPPTSTTTTTTPALVGIQNHGNTCYINAIVQCLSNTDLLAEYFLSGRYSTDLTNNLRNRFNNNANNTNGGSSEGEVTLALADFLHALWSKNGYSSKISMDFKRVVEQYSEQYRGNEQQDAQEFFYWLSDRVHEDLNVPVKRRYKLNKTRNKIEDDLATAAMEKHLEAHNSFISARFHGLFLSSITCPVCYKQSTKPDPFMCVSLPVSQSTKRPLFVVIVFLNRQPRLVRFGLNADVTATFGEVKKCLADATGLNAENMILCELNDRTFQSTLLDQNEVITLGETKQSIWALETPPAFATSPKVTRNHNSYTSTKNRQDDDEELILLVANQTGSNGNGRRFGSPVSLKVHREVSYGDLCRSILLAMRPQLKSNLHVQDISFNAFRLRIVDDYRPMVYLNPDVSLPLYTQDADSAICNTTPRMGVLHLKIMLEWHKDARDRYFSSHDEQIVDHPSAEDLRDQESNPETQGLRDCLSEFSKPELCQWYCPDCHRRRDEATKRIVLYWLPDILVLHLKRFKRQSNGQLVKLDSTVWFPTTDLDLTEFMAIDQSISYNGNIRKSQQRPYRSQNGESYLETNRGSENLYDLYAVCNHSGYSPNSGHYTAYCRNPVNGRWYCYDDQSVTPMRERDLVTNAAYLLFYERRQARINANAQTNGNGNGQQHSSSESGFVDHWYFRYAQRQRGNSNSSKDTLDGIDSNGSSSESQRKSQQLVDDQYRGSRTPESHHQQHKTIVQSSSTTVVQSNSPRQNRLFVKLPETERSREQSRYYQRQVIDHQSNGNRSSSDPRSIEHESIVSEQPMYKVIDRSAPPRPPPPKSAANSVWNSNYESGDRPVSNFPADDRSNGYSTRSNENSNGAFPAKINGTSAYHSNPIDGNLNAAFPAGKSFNYQKELEEIFNNKKFDDFAALPSCSKLLSSGIAAPLIGRNNGSSAPGSPAQAAALGSRRHSRTCSTVETDL